MEGGDPIVPASLWQPCQEQHVAAVPNTLAALPQGHEERAKPRSQRTLAESFPLSGINFPICTVGQLGGRHSARAQGGGWGPKVEQSRPCGPRTGEEPDSGITPPRPPPPPRRSQGSPAGFCVAHTGFSNLKYELSFTHPRSLPPNLGFQLV